MQKHFEEQFHSFPGTTVTYITGHIYIGQHKHTQMLRYKGPKLRQWMHSITHHESLQKLHED